MNYSEKHRIVITFNKHANVARLQKELLRHGVENQDLLESINVIVGDFGGDVRSLKRIDGVTNVAWERSDFRPQ